MVPCPGFGSPEQVGALLLSKFLVAFEGASLLLLVAAVGAVVLARRRRGLPAIDDPVAGEAAPTASSGTREGAPA